jgi:hypothetical protein
MEWNDLILGIGAERFGDIVCYSIAGNPVGHSRAYAVHNTRALDAEDKRQLSLVSSSPYEEISSVETDGFETHSYLIVPRLRNGKFGSFEDLRPAMFSYHDSLQQIGSSFPTNNGQAFKGEEDA